jgi:two-component system chemotaxis response regulator CheB
VNQIFAEGACLSGNVNASAVPATNVIVVGASSGGIGAVRTLLSEFPRNTPAAIFVVVHTSPGGPGMLPTVLSRTTQLTVVAPEDGLLARDGHVCVAPPDYHLIVDNRRVPLIDYILRHKQHSHG